MAQPSPVLEGEQRYGTGDDKHGEGAEAQQPDGKCRSIFVELEADKAVDQQAGAESRDESVLRRYEVRVRSRAGWGNASIEDERNNGQSHVDVEEGGDLFAACMALARCELEKLLRGGPTNSGEFGPHVDDHDNRHDEGENVHEVVGGLEDKRVRQHQRARITLSLDATATTNVLVADEGA